MENPRPEKVAVVHEVRDRLEGADAALLTEYRGLDVGAMAELRRALTAAGGQYKIYKNTLVRLAVRDLGLDLEELLVGPTAIAFVPPSSDGVAGDPVPVAKALKEFARGHPTLVVKGGVLAGEVLSAEQASALADIAPRDELLARLAGGLAAPMQQFASLLQALPRNLAYGLQALIEAGGAAGGPAPEQDSTAAAGDAAEPPPSADDETVQAGDSAGETDSADESANEEES